MVRRKFYLSLSGSGYTPREVAEHIREHCMLIFREEAEHAERTGDETVFYSLSRVREAPRGSPAYPGGVFFEVEFKPGPESPKRKPWHTPKPWWAAEVFVTSDLVVVLDNEVGVKVGYEIFKCIGETFR